MGRFRVVEKIRLVRDIVEVVTVVEVIRVVGVVCSYEESLGEKGLKSKSNKDVGLCLILLQAVGKKEPCKMLLGTFYYVAYKNI